MPKEKTDFINSSLIPHLSYLRRFTLIELLVVIAIIAILAGMPRRHISIRRRGKKPDRLPGAKSR